MKSKAKKRCIITAILVLIIIVGSFIFITNRKKISNVAINGSVIEKSLASEDIKEEIINEDNSQYDSIENGEVILLEYCGNEECAVVPKELDGRRIGKIDPKAFINKDNLEKIKIPIEIAKNVETIEDFKISEALSDNEYVVYITTKEYTESYLKYIQLTEEEKSKKEVIPTKFVISKEEKISMKKNVPSASKGEPSATIPSAYNLKNAISIPVKNQGELGICYAEVCTTMVETYLALRGNIRNESEIHLAVKSGQYGGGNCSIAYNNYWRHPYGPVNESGNNLLNQDYLISVRNSNALAGRVFNACKSSNGTLSASDVAAIDALDPGKDHYVLSMIRFETMTGDKKKNNSSAVINNRNEIKQAIMNNGAVYTAIASPNDSRIYVDNGTCAMMYCPDSSIPGQAHAVSIIGWDDNFSASNFPSSWGVTKNGAWTVQNSWGVNTGNNDGSFWISYEDYWVEEDNWAIGEAKIGRANVSNANISLSKTTYAYDGSAKTPAVTFSYNGGTYAKGVDYTVSYSNNINPGTATVTITGIGRFTGTVTKNFTIESKSIGSMTVTLGTSSYTYDGTAKTPTVTVKDGSTTLTNGTHYTVSYSNNINAGTATVTITGKGSYTGSTTKTFTISPKAISTTTITLAATSYTYDGAAKTPAVTVKNGSTTLTNGTHYTVAYSNNVNVGTATVTITGKGNFNGSTSKTFTISAKAIGSTTITLAATNYTYDGAAKTPAVTVKNGSTTLTNGTHYTVAYSNNVNVGTATVTITGKGNFNGSTSKTFTISPKAISTTTITLAATNYTYDGAAKTPAVTVKNGSTTLTNGTHYTVAYSNNVNAGTATVTITGKGNYNGTTTKNFTIAKGTIKLNITGTTYTYDGAEHTIGVAVTTPSSGATVKFGTEQGKCTSSTSPKYVNAGNYNIYYKVTAGSNYNELEGVQKLTIEAIDLSTTSGTLDVSEYTYDETAKTPNLTIKKGNATLKKGTEYNVTYSNNINAGEATVTATGIGNYKGTLSKKFTIKPQDLSKGTATLIDETIVYNTKEQTPKIEVKNSSEKVLQKDNDYNIVYSNNINAGTATFTVTGIKNYTGKITGTFTIEKADVEYEANDMEIVYDGKPHGLEIKFITQLTKVDIKYGTSKEECELDTTPTYTDVGDYKIFYTIVADNYNNIKGYIDLSIKPKDIKTAKISGYLETYIYDTQPKEPVVEVKDEIKTLILDKDYTIDYKNNTNVGTASIIATGIGNYTGVNKVEFEIEKGDPIYMLPSGIIIYEGATLEKVKLPKGFTWEDDLDTSVGEIRI